MFIDNVLCVAIRTDVFAAVLISVAVTLAARWGTTVWLLERACPNSRRLHITSPVSNSHNNNSNNVIPLSAARTQCLDTIAQALLVSMLVIVRQCRTLVTIQNSIVQLYEWITVVVLSLVARCHLLTRLPSYPLVTQRNRIRLRRSQQSVEAASPLTVTSMMLVNSNSNSRYWKVTVPITVPEALATLRGTTDTQHQQQRQRHNNKGSSGVQAERQTSNTLEHSTLETQVTHCESCETFLMDTCELHSN